MGAVLFALNPWLDPYMAGSLISRVVALGLLCGAGALVYGVAALVLRAYSLAELKAQLRRNPKAS